MNIKIKNVMELNLLRRINQLLGQYRIPEEILLHMEDILNKNDLGKGGYVTLLLTPIEHDDADILDELNLNNTQFDLPDDNYNWIQIRWGRHPMRNNRVWQSYDMVLKNGSGKIYVIYSITKRKAKELDLGYYV